MSAKEINIINPYFLDNKVSHVELTGKQLATRDRIRDKIEKNVYRFKASPCLCGEEDAVTISGTDRYGLPINTVICKHCGLLRTDPKPDDDFLNEFYRTEYRDLYTGTEYGDMDSYFLDMTVRGKEIFGLINKYAVSEFKNLKVLEIGCSAGGILLPFLEAGAAVKGYDYDRRYLDYGNNSNPLLNLTFGGFENLKDEEDKYDLILINHVLEHLSDPELVVKIIKKSLKSSGILYLSVPGMKNPAYYFSPSKSFLGSLHIAHLYHFTESSVERLFKGFDLLYIDKEIRSILKQSDERNELQKEEPVSEYSANLRYVQNYEKSFKRFYWRFKAYLSTVLSGIKSILPRNLVMLLKRIYRKIKG